MLDTVLALMVLKNEITLVTKKTKKETKVFVSDIWENGRIFVGFYTNRFGDIAIKHFDMTQYDFYL